jgi:uncharacterized membrane protein YhaH (DUF805 family)
MSIRLSQGSLTSRQHQLPRLGPDGQPIESSQLGGNVAVLIDPPEELSHIGPSASTVILAFGVLVTWISLAIAVKRYHDRDKSGWWALIIFLPVIGALWYLIECGFLRGTEGNNDYGPDPLSRY